MRPPHLRLKCDRFCLFQKSILTSASWVMPFWNTTKFAEKYIVRITQIQYHHKQDCPDDDVELHFNPPMQSKSNQKYGNDCREIQNHIQTNPIQSKISSSWEISSQILANWKWDQPDDDFEQFASARIWFQPPNSKLVLLEIWRYLQRNTAWVPHKYLWIGNKINPMMILSSLPEVDFNLPILKLVLVEIWGYLQRNTASLPHKYMWIRNMIIVMTIFSILIDFPFFRSQIWPPVPEICHSEIRKHLQRNTILESHKYMWIGNMIILMMMLNSLLLPEIDFLLPIQR